MATRDVYREQLLRRLSGAFPADRLTAAAAGPAFSVDRVADGLAGTIETLEQQHAGAAAQLRALVDGSTPVPRDTHGELAFVLHHLHHPTPELRALVDADPHVRTLWDAMAAVAPPSSFTPAEFASLRTTLPHQAEVKCNEWGDIYGFGKYEQLDTGWATTLKNNAWNHFPNSWGKGYGIHDFVTHDWATPVPLQAGADGKVRVAILGDWGSGEYTLGGLADPKGPAVAVMETLAALDEPPDYLVHLGDTYYSGTDAHRTPAKEEAHNLTHVLARYPQVARPGRCFTLNSNHEMYGGAWGYFDIALAHPLFSAQNGCSYFALAFGDWILAGIDSAYFDPSNLSMDGGLGDPAKDPQFAFLAQLEKLQASGRKVILMSHHTGLGTDGTGPSTYLWKDVTSVLRPDIWYWGHTHLGIVYGGGAYSGDMKTRCIGHSSMPFAIPPGMEHCGGTVDWYSHTPLEATAALGALWYDSPRAKNGFAMLTLDKTGIVEEVYDIGDTEPVWSSEGYAVG